MSAVLVQLFLQHALKAGIHKITCCWQESSAFNEKRDGDFSAQTALAYPTLTRSFSQTTVWHSGLHQVFGLTRWREKMTNTNTRRRAQRSPSFTDLLGAHFPLWQGSLAVPLYVWLCFCLHSESNFNTWQDLPQSTAILSILLFMSYSCRGLQ